MDTYFIFEIKSNNFINKEKQKEAHIYMHNAFENLGSLLRVHEKLACRLLGLKAHQEQDWNLETWNRKTQFKLNATGIFLTSFGDFGLGAS